MVLQSTGVISLSNIQTEFGGINPISLSEYYQNNALGYTTGVTGIPNTGAVISISNFYGKAKPASSLYSFTNHTFTNAGATGRTGPILSQVRSAYSAASWAQNASYLNMVTQGIQEWTVPTTGKYTIEVAGAAGGNSGVGGGNGARMIGTFNLTRGMVLAILVGQLGVVKFSNCNAGGGGGTFVWNKSSTTQPLIVGGGGGGSDACGGTRGLDAPTTINGTGGFGTSVAGANGNGATPGGSGWLTNGTSGLVGNNSGTTRPLQGGLGGAAVASYSIGDGGFGGGASAAGQSCYNGGAGGGGGYSGGAGPSGDYFCGSGGGGGSYNSGTNQANTAGVNTGHGYVKITFNAPFEISSIANLVLWHNGYNIDGSNNSTLSTGTAISSWYNSGSDSSLTTTQFTTSFSPTYILNGAVFSSGKSLISNINLNLSTYTAMNIFIVWKKTQSSSGLKWLWSQDNGGYDRTLIINADSYLMIGVGNGDAVFPTYSFPINSVVIVNCEYNYPGQTGYFFINNTSLTTFSNLTASGTTTTEFGSNGGGSNSIDGIIHEILIISRILPTTERTNIYNALVAKY